MSNDFSWKKRLFMKKTTLTSDSILQNVYDKFPSVAKIKEGLNFFYRGNLRLDDRHLPKKKPLLLWDPISALPLHVLLLLFLASNFLPWPHFLSSFIVMVFFPRFFLMVFACSCVVSPPNLVQPWLLAPIATWHTLYRVHNTLPIASWVSSCEFLRLDCLPLNSGCI